MAWESYQNAPGNFPNTPNTWGIYMCSLYVNYQLAIGGIGEMLSRSWARSTPIYQYIDQNSSYYRNRIDMKYRSRINIAFRIGESDARLERKFHEEAESRRGLIGLKGHSWVGGCRITLSNAMPFEGVFALISFMKEFKAENPLWARKGRWADGTLDWHSD